MDLLVKWCKVSGSWGNFGGCYDLRPSISVPSNRLFSFLHLILWPNLQIYCSFRAKSAKRWLYRILQTPIHRITFDILSQLYNGLAYFHLIFSLDVHLHLMCAVYANWLNQHKKYQRKINKRHFDTNDVRWHNGTTFFADQSFKNYLNKISPPVSARYEQWIWLYLHCTQLVFC